MNLLRNKTNNLRLYNTSPLLLDLQDLLQEFQFCISVPVKIVLSPNRLHLVTRIRHPMESMKSLQAQQRSSQKKTRTGVCPNFLAFRNQGAAESYKWWLLLPRLPLQMSSTAAGLYLNKAKQVVVFFNSVALHWRVQWDILPKKLCRSRQKPVWRGVMWEHYAAKLRVCFLFPDYRLSLGAGGSLQFLEWKD